jgi:hypothetical protein
MLVTSLKADLALYNARNPPLAHWWLLCKQTIARFAGVLARHAFSHFSEGLVCIKNFMV